MGPAPKSYYPELETEMEIPSDQLHRYHLSWTERAV